MQPYYDHAGITIYHGDCREILPTLRGIQLLLADPPYGIHWNCDYTNFTRGQKGQGSASTRIYPAVLGDNAPFDPRHLLRYPTVILWGMNNYPAYLSPGSLLIWQKRQYAGFLAQAEAAWMNRGTGVYIYSEAVERIQKERTHPTQKPLGLMRWCIEKANTPGLICDPYMGSGTTLRAAKDLGRTAIGIELDERYCEIAATRLSQEVLDIALSNV